MEIMFVPAGLGIIVALALGLKDMWGEKDQPTTDVVLAQQEAKYSEASKYETLMVHYGKGWQDRPTVWPSL